MNHKCAAGKYTIMSICTLRAVEISAKPQLSQRGHIMLHVINYCDKSLNVIRNDTLDGALCKSILVFHCLYVLPFLRHWTSNNSVSLKSGLGAVHGQWKWYHSTLGYSFLFAFHGNYGCIFSCCETIHNCETHPATHPPTHPPSHRTYDIGHNYA